MLYLEYGGEGVSIFRRPNYHQRKEGDNVSEDSKISKAQQKAVNKYVKNNYDRINVTLPKGQKDILREHAEKQRESVNAFIVRSINETMERDNTNQTRPAATSNKEPAGSVPEEPSQVQTPNAKRYKKLTEAAMRRIDLPELASNIRYQLDIADTYGQEALAQLLKKARQQDTPSGA